MERDPVAIEEPREFGILLEEKEHNEQGEMEGKC